MMKGEDFLAEIDLKAAFVEILALHGSNFYS